MAVTTLCSLCVYKVTTLLFTTVYSSLFTSTTLCKSLFLLSFLVLGAKLLILLDILVWGSDGFFMFFMPHGGVTSWSNRVFSRSFERGVLNILVFRRAFWMVIDPSGIGSVCLLLGEFSSPNPSYSIFGFALLVCLTVIYSIASVVHNVNLFFTKTFFIFWHIKGWQL